MTPVKVYGLHNIKFNEIKEKTFHVFFFPHNNRCRLSPMVLVLYFQGRKDFFTQSLLF